MSDCDELGRDPCVLTQAAERGRTITEALSVTILRAAIMSHYLMRSRGRTFHAGAFIGGSLAIGATVALPRRAWAATATVPLANFYSSIGLNAHSWYNNSLWPQRLLDLGILNIRGKVGQSTSVVQKLQTFFSNGGKINTGIVQSNNGTLDKTGAQKSLNFLKTNVGLQHVSGIEGPNEFNNGEPANWANTLRDFTHWLHDAVRADSAYNPIPLIGPSIWKRILADYKALGDVSQWVDKGCIHYYSGGQRPTTSGTDTMQAALQNVSIIAPGKTIWMTESGWQAPSGNWPISLRAQAKYVLRDYFDAFGFGVERLFMYQLMDDQSSLFGLCDAAANPKPAYNALKNLVGLGERPNGKQGFDRLLGQRRANFIEDIFVQQERRHLSDCALPGREQLGCSAPERPRICRSGDSQPDHIRSPDRHLSANVQLCSREFGERKLDPAFCNGSGYPAENSSLNCACECWAPSHDGPIILRA